MRMKLIIDVDTGVDDAEAIMMAVTHPDVEVLAITCVSGNTNVDQAMMNTYRVLSMCNATQVPMFRGSQFSLTGGGHDAAYFHGTDGMGDAPDAGPEPLTLPSPPTEHAASAIVRLVNKFPGEVVLVALAPLTNIALALHLDQGLGSKLQRCVVMGGTLDAIGNTPQYPCAEFNFSCDPEAAALVLDKMKCMIQLATWKTCSECCIDWDVVDNLMAIDTYRGRFHSAFMKQPIAKKRGRYSHFHSCDPCAMMTAIQPSSVLHSMEKYVTVELHGKHTRGQTIIDWRDNSGKTPNVQILTGLDSAQLLNLLTAMVS